MTTRGHHGLLLPDAGGGGAGPDVAVQTWQRVGGSSSHNVTLPASIASGDLLVMLFACRPGTPPATPSGWTLLGSANQSTNALGTWFYRWADGMEGATVAVSTSGSTAVATAQTYRIRGADAMQNPEIATNTQTNTVNPDPPSLTPTFGPANTLWIATVNTRGETDGVTAYPLPDNQTFQAGAGTSSDSSDSATCSQVSSGASLNPGTFTLTTGRTNVTATIAVKLA